MGMKGASVLYWILLLHGYTGYADAQCKENPSVDINTNITCTATECTLTCDEGYELSDNNTISCECDIATTTEDSETTLMPSTATIFNATTESPTTERLTTESLNTENSTSGTTSNETTSTAATTMFPTTQSQGCSWNVNQISKCVLTKVVLPTQEPRYVSWQAYWISTGILMVFVLLLVFATAYLLLQHFRARQNSATNSATPSPQINPAFNSDMGKRGSFDSIEQPIENTPRPQSPPANVPANVAANFVTSNPKPNRNSNPVSNNANLSQQNVITLPRPAYKPNPDPVRKSNPVSNPTYPLQQNANTQHRPANAYKPNPNPGRNSNPVSTPAYPSQQINDPPPIVRKTRYPQPLSPLKIRGDTDSSDTYDNDIPYDGSPPPKLPPPNVKNDGHYVDPNPNYDDIPGTNYYDDEVYENS